MNAALARRQAALAGVALLGALGAIALSRLDHDSEAAPPPPAAGVEWKTATVEVFEPVAEPTSERASSSGAAPAARRST